MATGLEGKDMDVDFGEGQRVPSALKMEAECCSEASISNSEHCKL